MSRRAPVVVIVALAAMLLAVTAAAQPTRLWTVPNLSGGSLSSPDAAAPTVSPQPGRAANSKGGSEWGFGAFVKALLVVLVIAALGVLIALRGLWPQEWSRRHARSRRTGTFSPLPDLAETPARLDVDAAREALSTGRPRSAIVACWMQLEHDIAGAGWPRDVAETSAEYVQRVVAQASVDRGAISDLAALFREARFSDHELRDLDRTHALDALLRVEAGLRSGTSVSI